MVLWLGFLLFQIIPIPYSLLDIISPAAARAYKMAGVQTALGSISVDRGMGVANFILAATYAIMFFMVLVFVENKRRLELLLWAVIINALLESFYGIASAGSNTIFGLWQRAHSTVSGSYPNRNHFAGLIQIAISINIGVLLSDLMKKRSLRYSNSFRYIVIDLLSGKQVLCLATIVIMLAALMLSASRGGILAFAVSLILVGSFSFKITKILKETAFSLLVPALAGIITAAFTAQLFLLRLLEGGNSGREYVWKPGLQMAADYGLLGSGLGTFQLAFPSYYTGPTQIWWHAHMDYLELFIELGVFGFLLLGGAIISVLFILVRSYMRRRNIFVSGILFGVLLGVASILLHEMSDYHFYIPANAAYLFILLGIGVVTTSLKTPNKPPVVESKDHDNPLTLPQTLSKLAT
jgi:O-antigen ligase